MMMRGMAAMVLVAGACIASPCEAAWDLITRSDDGLMNFYGDRSSIVPHGHLTQVRLLFDYAQLQQDPDTLIEHRSTIEVASVDCSGRRIAAVEATSYERNMGRGRPVVRHEPPTDGLVRFVKAAPASIDDKVVTFACTSRNHQAFSARTR
jgi:hypothetical protein